jgi:hypothetical protein
MGKQTAIRRHQRQLNKIQEMLATLLAIKLEYHLAEGTLTGILAHQSLSIHNLTKPGEKVGPLTVDQLPILRVTTTGTRNDFWTFKYDPKNGYLVDTTEFVGGEKVSGRIASTYSRKSYYGYRLSYLQTLLNKVTKWTLTQ